MLDLESSSEEEEEREFDENELESFMRCLLRLGFEEEGGSGSFGEIC
jgi:hypothetical protein